MKTKRLFALLLTLCMIASTFVAMPVSAATTTNVIDINAPLDDASELTWVASSSVTVTEADAIGGRDNVLKVEGLANSNNNTAGVILAESFKFMPGDVLTYSVDVYSESAINPDIWLRNHGNSLEPFKTFYSAALTANTWTAITNTVTYEDWTTSTSGNSGDWTTTGKFALYIRPRTNATVYFDNLKVTVSRVGSEPSVEPDEPEDEGNITVEKWPYVTEENGTYKVTTADIVANEAEGAVSSQVRLRIIPDTPISTDANIKISFDFTSEGILNSKGNEYSSLPVNLRLFDSVDGTKQANTIGYIKNNTVVANTGEAVSVTYLITDMEKGGGASTLTDIASIGVQVDMYGAYKQYVTAANDGYFAISNIKIEEVVEEPEAPAVTFDYSKYETTILAGTDFQAENNEVGAQNVTNIIGAVKESGLLSADAFLFCGDYENTSGKATTAGINAVYKAVGDFVPDKDNHVYIQGNHDAPIGTTGLAPSGNNDPESGDYGVFVIHEDDYGTENNIARTMDTAANLADYLNEKLEAGYDKPIFVMSHVPLYYSLRTLNFANAKHADHIFHVLNQAGAQGLEIIFLAGHDHSKAYESYLGGAAVYLAKGDKINIAQSSVINFKEETLNFTYMNAGYVGYYNVGTGADNVINMLVIGIDEDTDTVDVYRFDKKGLHNLKSEGKLLEGEEDLYTANTTVYTSPQTIASSSVNYEKEITTLPAVSINGEKLVDINLPIDDVSEITWTGSSAVTVSNADGIGGRDNVIKAEGLADSNNNTVGVKLADGFAFQDGDIISYSFDVYSETEINPDIWLRNHASGLKPFVSFYSGVMATNKWTTVARTVEFAELDLSTDYDWTTVGNYAIYLRPRQNATVYLDNIKVTVTRPIEVRGNIVDVDLPLDEASELTWKTDAVTVTEADGISGRDNVLKLEGLSNSNNNTAGIKLADGFAFQKGDIITYSLDVYSDTVTHPDLWLRNHNGSVLSPFTTFYHEVKTGEWTTITKTVSFDGLESKYDWTTVGNYALYVRPREAGTVYVDNFTVTVSRKDYVPPHEHEYGEWIMEDDDNHKMTCECGDSVIEAHSWDEGVVTTEPTTSVEGVKTYTCTVCGGTTTETIPTKPSAGGGRLGDLDGDGEIGVKDVISLRRFITSGFNVTVNEGAADVNKDGRVGVKDVVVIRRFIAGGYGVEI